MILFTRVARKRWLLAQIGRAHAAWQALGKMWLAGFGAELDGAGDTSRTWRLQRALARCRFKLQEYAKALQGV